MLIHTSLDARLCCLGPILTASVLCIACVACNRVRVVPPASPGCCSRTVARNAAPTMEGELAAPAKSLHCLLFRFRVRACLTTSLPRLISASVYFVVRVRRLCAQVPEWIQLQHQWGGYSLVFSVGALCPCHTPFSQQAVSISRGPLCHSLLHR